MSQIKTASVTEREMDEIRKENDFVYIKSRFNFIKAHNGLRPSCLHILLGTSGSGKSTLAKAIIIDCAVQYKTLLWQSEEKRENFIVSLKNCSPDKKITDNIILFSELDLEPQDLKTPDSVFDKFEYIIKLHKPKIVFLDNITTSQMYMGLNPNDQDKMIWKIKRLFSKLGTPIILIAHTGSYVNESTAKIIEDSDIRGSKTIMNLAEYVYIFQRFEINSRFFPTVRIRKSRNHQLTSKLFYLQYNREKNIYTDDKDLDFSNFKEAYGQRNKL